MILQNIELAVQNFVLSYYNTADVIMAYECAMDFLDNEEELSQFDDELVEYLNGNSEIVVEGYNGLEFFPIRLGIDSDLQRLIEYIGEKV